jgi:riboflavin kinase/FMN adenylyltransferase
LVTFEPHPLRIVAPERAPCLLTTPIERRLLWPQFGLDYVVVVPFDDRLRQLSPETFVRDVLVQQLRLGELVIGYDHGFGKDRKGDVETLRRLGMEEGFSVDVVGPITSGDETVSSTKIRGAVAGGDLAIATAGMGRPYSAYGRVVRGAGRGRSLGFATANLELELDKCLPPEGVYAVLAEIDGERHQAMANLGPRPTFGGAGGGLEAHLLDWSGEPLYGALVGIEFVRRLRPVKRFDGPEELSAQLGRDRAAARTALADSQEVA